MKFSAPKSVTVLVAFLFVLVGILMALGVFSLDFISAFWMVVIGFVILAAGNLFPNV